MKTRFEWDEVKARSNLMKHGVSFEVAALIFGDPWIVQEQDRIESGEPRWRSIGMVSGVSLLVVAHTIHDGEIEIIRIISARRAQPRERQRYERQDG